MIKSTKITDEELQEVKSLQQDFQLLTYQIGEISLQRELAQKQVKKLDSEFNDFMSSFEKLQEREKEIVDKLNTTYPDKSIDLETGELS